jgi:hypothetical protein
VNSQLVLCSTLPLYIISEITCVINASRRVSMPPAEHTAQQINWKLQIERLPYQMLNVGAELRTDQV